jgi:hypothetical protein
MLVVGNVFWMVIQKGSGVGVVISLERGAAWAGKTSGEFWERLIPEDIAGLDAAEDSNRLTTSLEFAFRRCPFLAL